MLRQVEPLFIRGLFSKHKKKNIKKELKYSAKCVLDIFHYVFHYWIDQLVCCLKDDLG